MLKIINQYQIGLGYFINNLNKNKNDRQNVSRTPTRHS
jgi:hypothetical protein